MADRRILFLNPLGERYGYDQLFADMAQRCKLPGTEVTVASLPDEIGGFSHIEYRAYEAMVTWGIIRAARAAGREGFDAMVIGCFYDTAIHDAREISGDMIVTAPCESSCEIASTLANTFGIIIGRRKWQAQMQARVFELGHRDRLAGFADVDLGVTDFQADHDRTNNRLLAAGRKLVEEHHAEALILGCTMEIGFHETLQDELGVPVIDPSMAAFKRAEYAAVLKRQCGWKPSRRWSCEAPPEDELARIGVIDGDAPVMGQRIVVPA